MWNLRCESGSSEGAQPARETRMCPPKCDWVKSRHYAHLSADQGSIVGQAFFGYLLWTYCGGGQDVPTSHHYARMALRDGLQELALTGDKNACSLLAEMFRTALCVPWNDRMAFALHSRALPYATSRCAHAFLRMQGMPDEVDAKLCAEGLCSLSECSVMNHDKGMSDGMEMFRTMSDGGLSQAMWYLGDIYRHQASTLASEPLTSHRMAFELYEKAHLKGHPRSSYLLGRYLSDGFKGLEGGDAVIDKNRARQCFAQARISGFVVADDDQDCA